MHDVASLRARVCLRALLPLVEPLSAGDARARAQCGGAPFSVLVAGGAAEARLVVGGGSARVERVAGDAEVRLVFGSERELADFFAGRPVLPSASALRSPLLFARTLRLLARLRILDPRSRIAPEEAALYTRLVLRFVARGVAELARPGGDPEAVHLAERSPDRVYQWRVAESGEAAWVRLAAGRVGTGVGSHPTRAPFVETLFPTTAAACRVLGGATSRMESVARGDVESIGSPEYARKVSVLAQRLDVLARGDA